ncbi:MAG TPA: hypothetical protein VE076_06590 [Nitrososphaeraceae archaeon]|nr:hypothetical protein [Nitrososphaeraceae archaeon]
MPFWSRKDKSKDPLLKNILDKYHLNLLSVPRENASVGDLYVQDGNVQHLSSPGSVSNFLEPKFEIPQVRIGETMADISGTSTRAESTKVGLDVLEGFLNALGPVGLGSKVRGSYERDNKQTIKFSFTSATRDYVDPILLGSKLGEGQYKFNTKNALYAEDRKYFVVTAVAKSGSFAISAEGDRKQLMDIDAEVKQLINTTAGVSIESSGSGQITFKGNKSLVFGVELFELKYDINNQKFAMSTISEAMGLRGEVQNRPSLIGDPTEGDAFVALSNY